jgi:hypothetical protein
MCAIDPININFLVVKVQSFHCCHFLILQCLIYHLLLFFIPIFVDNKFENVCIHGKEYVEHIVLFYILWVIEKSVFKILQPLFFSFIHMCIQCLCHFSPNLLLLPPGPPSPPHPLATRQKLFCLYL